MKKKSAFCSHNRAHFRAHVWLCWLVLFTCRLYGKSGAELPAPGQIGDVVCATDATQSYGLYLPLAYTPARKWPIIYFFDPAGRGQRPLELYKELGDKYGFILAASNNSRNFSSEQSKIVNAIWFDTHVRLALDTHRIYASGFSGGARVAGAMARGCPKCEIAGVIAHGAGYPSNQVVSGNKPLYFFAVGDQDFNWPEIMNIRREREEHGQPYRVRVFSGTHQWAPQDVMEDAVQWLSLRSMQSGDLKAEPGFIDQQLQRAQAAAEAAKQANDALAELDAYHSLISDFVGLRDTSEFATKLAALKQSSAFKSARKAERDNINEQFSLESEISPKLRTYAEGSEPDPSELGREIQQAMSRLHDQAVHAKSEAKRAVFTRAFEDMWAEGIENGQQELAARHFEKAEACFELMSQIRDNPWPFLLLAQTHTAAGKKKDAMRDLQQAVKHGLKDADALESNPGFQVLKSEPEFQQLVSQLK